MNDDRFQFERLVVAKGVIENEEHKVLLIKEPETNAWMPNKWGLPGGKPFKNESLTDCFKRKMKEEIGKEIKPDSFLRVEELVLDERSVYMFIFLAKGKDKKLDSKNEVRWVDRETLEKMKISDFTEYYTKDLLMKFFNGDLKPLPTSIVNLSDFSLLEESNEDFQTWWQEAQKYVE